MLKFIIIATSLIGLLLTQGCGAVPRDQLGLAGTYQCTGYDKHDGFAADGKVLLTLDAKNSDFSNNYGAYRLKLIEKDGTTYVGEAAASGNSLAIYFENTSPTMTTDRGVGIATVSHDADSHGKTTTVFHKFYYQPTYQKGGNGYDTCVKQS